MRRYLRENNIEVNENGDESSSSSDESATLNNSSNMLEDPTRDTLNRFNASSNSLKEGQISPKDLLEGSGSRPNELFLNTNEKISGPSIYR